MHCRLIWPLLVAVVASGQIITTFAGNGIPGYQGDNGPAIQAQISNVLGLAADAAGNIYLADSGNHVVRKVDTSGVITTFAGLGAAGFTGDQGLATQARLNAPTGVCVGPSGDVYVNDVGNRRVRKIAASTGIITTVAGSGSLTPSGDGGPAISAGMHVPNRCAVDQGGNLYIVDQGTDANVVRKVDTNGMISNYAGVYGGTGFSGDGGPATLATMFNLTAITIDASGNLYLTDQGDQRIRRVDTNGIITTVAGNGIAGFAGDNGPATSASLSYPGETAIDPAGNLFIVDTVNQVIRKVTPEGIISTVAGSQVPGFGGDNGPPLSAQFNGPFALTLDPAGNLYVGDTANARVRKIVSLASGPLPCTYSLSSGGQGFTAAGGSGSVNIAAGPGCQWTIPNLPVWIVVTGYPPNGGNGTVTYQVGPNGAGDRSVTLTGNGLSYTVEQEATSSAIPGLNVIGTMAHLAAQENWTSTFTLVNKALVPTIARLSFFGDATVDPTGDGTLTLPLAFPQRAGAPAPLLAATIDRALGPSESLVVTTPVSLTSPVLVGSARLASANAVDGFAIFHQVPTGQEAVVPMESRKATSYLLAFDNTSDVVLGVAVENVAAQDAVIPVIIRDDNGTVINTGSSISLGANGHTSFVLSDQTHGFPITANKRGTVEFDTPPGGQISVLGLRFTPPNNALTTIPAMAQVGTGGGNFAHLASGGDGWQTTFVLVNTGSTATSATLSFFRDQTGVPLTLPLAFPQSGPETSMSVASYTTPQLAAGAMHIIVSSGATELLTGSAQLTSPGNVSGFVIFRHDNQEAVVPLESRNSLGFIIPFDNTRGTATGIAVSAVSSQQVSIPVTVRNDTGAALYNDTITLAKNGHYAFTLGTDRYPGTRTIRGTIEFITPQDVAISALGIRIPAGATPIYTTLPALAR